MVRHGLKQWCSTWWEGRANPRELRCKQCIWVTWRAGARIHPFQPSFKGCQWKGRYLIWRSLCMTEPHRHPEGKQLLSLISAPTVIASKQVLRCCSQRPCYSSTIFYFLSCCSIARWEMWSPVRSVSTEGCRTCVLPRSVRIQRIMKEVCAEKYQPKELSADRSHFEQWDGFSASMFQPKHHFQKWKGMFLQAWIAHIEKCVFSAIFELKPVHTTLCWWHRYTGRI